jgi:hypothetical protein
VVRECVLGRDLDCDCCLTCLSLAMAEMALVPSVYKKYTTQIATNFEGVAPGITSRFEVFSDETFGEVKVL